MGEYANDVLVSTDWLAENIDNPDVRIVEVDEDTEAYERGHIRNALGVNWKSDLQDPLRRDFISGPDFE
jgi:thiosulfate/3-mercaptopyruvate sulfurtransferase